MLRAGYGMFYAKTTNSTYYATRVENGVIQQTFNCNPTTCPALTFPNLIFTPPGASARSALRGSADAAGGSVRSAFGHADRARPGSGLGEPAGASKVR